MERPFVNTSATPVRNSMFLANRLHGNGLPPIFSCVCGGRGSRRSARTFQDFGIPSNTVDAKSLPFRGASPPIAVGEPPASSCPLSGSAAGGDARQVDGAPPAPAAPGATAAPHPERGTDPGPRPSPRRVRFAACFLRTWSIGKDAVLRSMAPGIPRRDSHPERMKSLTRSQRSSLVPFRRGDVGHCAVSGYQAVAGDNARVCRSSGNGRGMEARQGAMRIFLREPFTPSSSPSSAGGDACRKRTGPASTNT